MFDPERKEWTDGSKNAFFSFGLGPRACIGEDLARKEIKTGAPHTLPTGLRLFNSTLLSRHIAPCAVASMILQKYELRLVESHPVEMEMVPP